MSRASHWITPVAYGLGILSAAWLGTSWGRSWGLVFWSIGTAIAWTLITRLYGHAQYVRGQAEASTMVGDLLEALIKATRNRRESDE